MATSRTHDVAVLAGISTGGTTSNSEVESLLKEQTADRQRASEQQESLRSSLWGPSEEAQARKHAKLQRAQVKHDYKFKYLPPFLEKFADGKKCQVNFQV